MSFKRKVLAATATLTLSAESGRPGHSPREPPVAATPSCGGVVHQHLRQGVRRPLQVAEVHGRCLRQGERVGQPIILFRTSNYDPALDWTYSFQGTVQDFWQAGLVSAAVALHYGCVVGTGRYEFSDCYGRPGCGKRQGLRDRVRAVRGRSGLCMGVASAAISGEGVTLQPCG